MKVRRKSKSMFMASEKQPDSASETAGLSGKEAAMQKRKQGGKSSSKSSKGSSGESGNDKVESTVDAAVFSTSTSYSFSDVPPIAPLSDMSGFDEFKYSADADGFSELDSLEELLSGDAEYGKLPLPEVFNEYPPEVQRKIMEWTDRDVRARRDDASRRQDEMTRAIVERNRRNQIIPAVIIVLALICGAVTSIVSGNPLFAFAFMIVPVVVIVARVVTDDGSGKDDKRSKPSR